MKLVLLALVFCVAFVHAQQEGCAQLCAEIDPSSCPCGLTDDVCCPTCCSDCVNCFVDPCEDWACQGYPGYVCESNYCGGCNRDWFTSSGEPVECEFEVHVSLNSTKIFCRFSTSC
jgi:hypothetical protein